MLVFVAVGLFSSGGRGCSPVAAHGPLTAAAFFVVQRGLQGPWAQ